MNWWGGPRLCAQHDYAALLHGHMRRILRPTCARAPLQPLGAAVGRGEEHWKTLERVSYVWLKNRWVAYPFQNNISALDKEDQIKCLAGVVEAKVLNTVAQVGAGGEGDGAPDGLAWHLASSMREGCCGARCRPTGI